MSLSVDGSSAVTAEPADRPLNDGFAEFPAVLRPVYQVATDRTDVTGLDTVVGMVAALQRLSTVPLSPTLVDVAALGSSDQPGVLIAARSAVPASLALPLDHTAAGVTLANGDALTVDADLASLQVVDQDARTVLVATSTQPSSTAYAAMLTWLRAGDHLGSIGGDVLVWPADGDHQTLAVVGGGERTIDAAAEPLWQQRTVQLLAISVVLAVIVGLLAFLLLRGRGGAVRSGDSTADRRSGGREPVTAGYARRADDRPARRADDRPARRAEDRRTEPAADTPSAPAEPTSGVTRRRDVGDGMAGARRACRRAAAAPNADPTEGRAGDRRALALHRGRHRGDVPRVVDECGRGHRRGWRDRPGLLSRRHRRRCCLRGAPSRTADAPDP